MSQWIFKRFLQMIAVWFAVSIFAFAMMQHVPGDPLYMYMTPGATGHKMTDAELERMRASLGLDGSKSQQYLRWIRQLFRGNLGISIQTKKPVLEEIVEKFPHTAGLMGISLAVSLIISIPLGLLAGIHKHKSLDTIISAFTYIGISIPAFWLGIMLIICFSMWLRWLPSSGMRTIGVSSAWDVLRHGLLPSFVLSVGNMAVFIRYIRSNTIAQLEEEYVITAVSKGLSKRSILLKEVLKNCLLPVMTIVGSRLGTLVTGSFIVEYVFQWPGLGSLGMSALNNRDYPLVMGITMFACTLLLVGNFLADVLYGCLDPRIRQERKV